MAGEGAAPARLPRRAEPAARNGRARDRADGQPSWLRPGLPAGALGIALWQSALPPDLPGGRASRSRRRYLLRRRAGQPADAERLALLLSGGVRRYGVRLPVAGAQPDRRGRVRPLPDAPSDADRERRHLAASTP